MEHLTTPAWVHDVMLDIVCDGKVLYEIDNTNAKLKDVVFETRSIKKGSFIWIKDNQYQIDEIQFDSFGNEINSESEFTMYYIRLYVHQMIEKRLF